MLEVIRHGYGLKVTKAFFSSVTSIPLHAASFDNDAACMPISTWPGGDSSTIKLDIKVSNK